MTDLREIYRSDVVDEVTKRQLDKAKLLPNGNFVCECHLLEVEYASLDRHHEIPEEVGGLMTPENMKYLCSSCHQLLHRLALMLMATKAVSKRSPLETAVSYARRMNKARESEVVVNLLRLAQMVAHYKTMKAEHDIAPPDGAIVVADMPNEFKVLFKQIAWEIKRGDGRGIGMANLGAMAILELVAKHRPEKRQQIDTWIQHNVLYVQPVARAIWQAADQGQETPL